MKKYSTMTSATSLQAPSEEPVVVLLVDDQEMISVALERMFHDEDDIQFHYVSEPIKAVDIARVIKPTVILQDLVMPDIDGLTMVRYYRANPSTKDTPVIVLSSKEDPETKMRSFAYGANDYLVKLPDKLELLARVRYHSQA